MRRALLIPILAAALPCRAAEPDGSRPVGIVPPYRAQPAPPPWLRGLSLALAEARGVATRHYVYEAYGDGAGAWLVRYRSLAAAGEAVLAPQATFLFGLDPSAEPRPLAADAVRFGRREALWRERRFALVDRRDLLRPRRPVRNGPARR